MKNRFYGRYYKFISLNGFPFAFIKSNANEGDMLQLITKEKAFFIKNTESIKINGNVITFDINEDDLSFKGFITLGEYHPLKRKVMGPFTHLPLECKHFIDSMYHSLSGEIVFNGKTVSFDDGRGYIEGDMGTNFPKKYIWYNSITNDASITFAIASIPLFGFIHFTGILCFVKTREEEYYMCTYNSARALKISEQEIIIKKGKYRLVVSLSINEGHDLKAPVKGNMSRYIKENLSSPSSYSLIYKDKVILENKDGLSSFEYVWY